MKKQCVIAMMCLAFGTVMYGQAYAHGAGKHGRTDAQMMKLHAMMPVFSVASAGMETALEKGDLPSLEAESGKITAATPDLKKSHPHKNVKQRKKFVELAENLEKQVTSTLALAKNGDVAGAKAAFKKVEAACAECHAKFRD